MRALAALTLTALIASGGRAAPPPWQRTETREPCANADPLRRPFFGDLHVHTRYSADAYIFGTKTTPADAYAFAKGATIPVTADDETMSRSAHLDRPLDFTAVTDHAEFFGEVRVCDTPGSPVYDISLCQQLRQVEPDLDAQNVTIINWQFPLGLPGTPHHSFCQTPGVDCTASAISVWQDEQAAAEAAYDRTSACTFTSFVGYEYTASTLGKHLHRNVIFRNEHVLPQAMGYLETEAGGLPQGLWTAVEDGCLNAGTGCDALIIPHNSNLSGGEQWKDPADATEALRRQTIEPLAEIHQIKANSECRFDRLANAGAGTNDELCTFEQDPEALQGPLGGPIAIDKYPLRNMIRNTLKDGLALEQTLGVNPFRLGFTGSTDNHNASPGYVDEAAWSGGQGDNDSSPARLIQGNIHTNPGGLTVAWAEENSRDAIFSALRRRETYATSGTRPVVRFFGGDLSGVRCGDQGFVHDAYASGTAMGGELGAVRGARSPRFAVWAMKDPGSDTAAGTDLQRVQIVKGWVDADGKTHEQVFDVAGDASAGASVDPATCAPTGTGFAELCKVWEDPGFKRTQRAFYYARVVENPTCRWSTFVCRAAGVDPLAADCAAQAAQAGPEFANCCLGPTNDASVDPLVQERAWTSPIWYRPEAIGRVKAAVRYGAQPGTDRLALRVALSGVPGDLDPSRLALTVRVTDDDEIFAATIPAGTLTRRGRRWSLPQPLGGLQKARLDLRGKRGAMLLVQTAALDLSHADRSEHPVTVALESGTFRASHTRLWTMRKDRLVPEGR